MHKYLHVAYALGLAHTVDSDIAENGFNALIELLDNYIDEDDFDDEDEEHEHDK